MNERISLPPQLRDWMDAIDAHQTPRVLSKDMVGIPSTLRAWMQDIESAHTETEQRAVSYEGLPFEARAWMAGVEPAVDYANELSPPLPSVQVLGAVQFSVAHATGDLTWTVAGGSTHGTIDSDGLYTAPASVPTPATAVVTAVDEEVPAGESVSTTVSLVDALVIDPSTASLAPEATQQFTRTGGTAPFAWSIVEGAGHGTISAAGLYTAPAEAVGSVTVRITDSCTVPQAADSAVTVESLPEMFDMAFTGQPVDGTSILFSTLSSAGVEHKWQLPFDVGQTHAPATPVGGYTATRAMTAYDSVEWSAYIAEITNSEATGGLTPPTTVSVANVTAGPVTAPSANDAGATVTITVVQVGV